MELYILFSVAGTIITLIVFYYIIKGAVKNGIIDAHECMNQSKNPVKATQDLSETLVSPEKKALRKRYERSEISLDEYTKQFNALK